ncbi:hypothetical protein [Pseudolysinimonas sp.]|uniref:hypothetical protein n=1 Tax=Pseudolysinimonas sp. TaxID=2680009 RepID=UPI003F7EF709
MSGLRGLVQARPAVLDPGTSLDAAAKLDPSNLTLVQSAILRLLRENGPSTDERIESLYQVHRAQHPHLPMASPQSLRTRRHELVIAGQVRDSGKRGSTRYGNASAMWEARS